jgi:hypothetical protein
MGVSSPIRNARGRSDVVIILEERGGIAVGRNSLYGCENEEKALKQKSS